MKIAKPSVDQLLTSGPDHMSKSEKADMVDSLISLKISDLSKSSSPSPSPTNVLSKLTIEKSNLSVVPCLDETQSTADCTTPTSLQSDSTATFNSEKVTSSPKDVNCTEVTASSLSDEASPASIKTADSIATADGSTELGANQNQPTEAVSLENATPSSTATSSSFHSAKDFTSPVPGVKNAENGAATGLENKLATIEDAGTNHNDSLGDGGRGVACMKIVYGTQTRNITLLRQTRADGVAPATEELADLLGAAFAIPNSQRIVGFAAKKVDGDTSGPVFVPLSVVAFGQYKDSEETEFELLVKNRDENALAPYDEEVSVNSSTASSIGDMTLTVDSFVLFVRGLVEDKQLNPVYGEVLSKHVQAAYGTDEIKGPIKMAFVLAEWTRDVKRLTAALSALGEAILREQLSDDVYDVESETHLRLSNMDFLLEAVELAFLESQDKSQELGLEQFMALSEAIITSHPSIVAVYKAYRTSLRQSLTSRDSSVSAAFGTDDEQDDDSPEYALDFLLYALHRIGLSLQPIEEGSLGDDEEEFSHAELALTVAVRKLPESAQETIVMLFKEGDEFLRTALQIYLMDDDMEELENAVLLRLKFYEEAAADIDGDTLALIDSSAKSIIDDCPQSVVTAVAVLVEHKRITEDAAAAIVSTFSMGNAVTLELVYSDFLENGDVLTFLYELELFVKDVLEKENSPPEGKCPTSGLGSGDKYDPALAESMLRTFHEMMMAGGFSPPPVKPEAASIDCDLEVGSAGDGDDQKTVSLRDVFLKQLDELDLTGTEIQALKLAAARGDSLLLDAIGAFKTDKNSDMLKLSRYLTQQVSMSNEHAPLVNQRKYAMQLLALYLVDNNQMSTYRAKLLLDGFDDDEDLQRAFAQYEATGDAAELVGTLQNIPI